MADETNETSNTATGLQLQRWTLRGDCAAAQGRDGVLELTRTAYASLRAAAWEKSAAAPSMPVHDNGQVANKEIPEGDAWKCSYGYDETARTERAAAGAVCYTAELPAGAWTGDGCNVETVAVRVVGDRYLDQGAIVRVALTDDPAPPSVAAFEALATAAGPLCATSGQTDAKGAELAPNNRTGEREDAEISFPEGTAAKRYLHVALFLADYLGARGAWIEGGAMIAPDTIAVTFDRAAPAANLPQVRLVVSSTKPYSYTSGSSSYTIEDGEYYADFTTNTFLGTRYPETGRPFLLAVLSGAVGRYGANGAKSIPSIGQANGSGLAVAGVMSSPRIPILAWSAARTGRRPNCSPDTRLRSPSSGKATARPPAAAVCASSRSKPTPRKQCPTGAILPSGTAPPQTASPAARAKPPPPRSRTAVRRKTLSSSSSAAPRRRRTCSSGSSLRTYSRTVPTLMPPA